MLLGDAARRPSSRRQAAPATAALAEAINGSPASATQLRARHRRARSQEASRGIEQERSRLAALMSELTQSVVVCNLDGRILLYNGRARLLFRALSRAPARPAAPS